MNDYDVTLSLDVDPGGEPVEALALRGLDAVERHAPGVALGPVVGGTTDPPTIELEFDVVAASNADAHQRVARVIGVIERHARIGGLRRVSVVEREPLGVLGTITNAPSCGEHAMWLVPRRSHHQPASHAARMRAS